MTDEFARKIGSVLTELNPLIVEIFAAISKGIEMADAYCETYHIYWPWTHASLVRSHALKLLKEAQIEGCIVSGVANTGISLLYRDKHIRILKRSDYQRIARSLDETTLPLFETTPAFDFASIGPNLAIEWDDSGQFYLAALNKINNTSSFRVIWRQQISSALLIEGLEFHGTDEAVEFEYIDETPTESIASR